MNGCPVANPASSAPPTPSAPVTPSRRSPASSIFLKRFTRLARQAPQEAQIAHRMNACSWLAEHGMTELALKQAANAGNFDRVVELLDQSFGAMMGQNDVAKMGDYIRSIPEGVANQSLWAIISASVSCEMRRSFVRESAYMRTIFDRVSGQGRVALTELDDEPLTYELLAMRMLSDYHKGNIRSAIDQGEQALSESTLDQRSRCSICNVMGILHWHRGGIQQARRYWQESCEAAMYVNWPYSICLNLFGIARAHYLLGSSESAIETCQRIFAISNQYPKGILSSGYAHLLMAKIHYDRNELAKAKSESRTARRIALAGDEQVMAMEAEMALARVDLAMGKKAEAISRANKSLSKFCSKPEFSQSFDEAHALMAQVWLLAGKTDLARDFLNYMPLSELNASGEPDTPRIIDRYVFGSDFRNVWNEEPLFANAFLLCLETQTQDIMPLLNAIHEELGSRGLGLLVEKAPIVKTLCEYANGNVEAALANLAQALAIGEASRNVRIFVDAGEPMLALLRLVKRKHLGGRFANEIVGAFERRSDSKSSGTGSTPPSEAFTSREREIMELICEGATNDEIAKRPYLSLSTVKNHIHHVYTKLGVRNRAEAISRIREL